MPSSTGAAAAQMQNNRKLNHHKGLDTCAHYRKVRKYPVRKASPSFVKAVFGTNEAVEMNGIRKSTVQIQIASPSHDESKKQ